MHVDVLYRTIQWGNRMAGYNTIYLNLCSILAVLDIIKMRLTIHTSSIYIYIFHSIVLQLSSSLDCRNSIKMREEKELFTGSYLQQVLEILTEILLQPPSYEPHPPPNLINVYGLR